MTTVSMNERDVIYPIFGTGDYVMFNGAEFRVLRVNGCTLTVRPVHRWRWVEWLHWHLERLIAVLTSNPGEDHPPS